MLSILARIPKLFALLVWVYMGKDIHKSHLPIFDILSLTQAPINKQICIYLFDINQFGKILAIPSHPSLSFLVYVIYVWSFQQNTHLHICNIAKQTNGCVQNFLNYEIVNFFKSMRTDENKVNKRLFGPLGLYENVFHFMFSRNEKFMAIVMQ